MLLLPPLPSNVHRNLVVCGQLSAHEPAVIGTASPVSGTSAISASHAAAAAAAPRPSCGRSGVLCRANFGRAVIDLLEGCDACLRDHIVLRTGATTHADGTDYFAADY